MSFGLWFPEPTSTRTSRTSSPVETQAFDALEGGDLSNSQSKQA